MQTIKFECAQSCPHNNWLTIEHARRVEFMPDVNIFYCYYWLIKVIVNTSDRGKIWATRARLFPARAWNSTRPSAVSITYIRNFKTRLSFVRARSRKRACFLKRRRISTVVADDVALVLLWDSLENAYSICTTGNVAYSTKVFSRHTGIRPQKFLRKPAWMPETTSTGTFADSVRLVNFHFVPQFS